MMLTLHLDLRCVRDSGTNPDAVRLVFSNGSGGTVATFETRTF